MTKEAKSKHGAGASTESGPISDASHHKAAASKAFLENHYRDLLREARSGGVRTVGPREKEPTIDDYHLIKCVGRGAFGEVYVCQKKGDPTNQLYALKRMRKTDMIKKKHVLHVRSEKDVLAQAAARNPWVVRLYVSFQDEHYLYMVMEYMPAGDMISWLCEKGMFDLESTRFYIAELCVAVASVHAMYFVHRDIKPDNILFAADGHIKLSDFGLSKRFGQGEEELLIFEDNETSLDSNTNVTPLLPPSASSTVAEASSASSDPRRGAVSPSTANSSTGGAGAGAGAASSTFSTASPTGSPVLNSAGRQGTTGSGSPLAPTRERIAFDSIVGSPGYIAPEILLRHRYGVNCDWWSVGVIMYEMLYGIPPFYSQDPSSTCHKITHWKDCLRFPSDRGVPDVAVDFMRGLMCDPADRMDFEEIRRHPFFDGLDLEHLREMRAAYQPMLSNPLDTKYFPEIDEQGMQCRPADERVVKEMDPRGVMFADFKFNAQRRRYLQLQSPAPSSS